MHALAAIGSWSVHVSMQRAFRTFALTWILPRHGGACGLFSQAIGLLALRRSSLFVNDQVGHVVELPAAHLSIRSCPQNCVLNMLPLS